LEDVLGIEKLDVEVLEQFGVSAIESLPIDQPLCGGLVRMAPLHHSV
jgi:hypothetical protein